jgi:hypothetical protein
MTAEDARQLVKTLTQATSEPTLDDDTIGVLVTRSALADRAGREPFAEDWIETYDVNAAARDGWLLKAAKAASTSNVRLGDLSVSSGEQHGGCIRMANEFAKRIQRAAVLGRSPVPVPLTLPPYALTEVFQ